MNILLNSSQMKNVERYTIETVGIPSLVLMERAALGVFEYINSRYSGLNKRIVCVCGYGNNGADGVAVARMLHNAGERVEVMLVGDEAKATEEMKLQLKIAKQCGVSLVSEYPDKVDIIVDAIFGIGISRVVTDKFAEAIDYINNSGAFVVSVDVPSGVKTENGEIMGIAVNADVTVTFGVKKTGLLQYPAAKCSGKIVVWDAGFPLVAFEHNACDTFEITKQDLRAIPDRKSDGNKGTFGKVLIIAGNDEISGAAVLSAGAALRSGCGLVKVFTTYNNSEILKKNVPEALVATYDVNMSAEALKDRLKKELDWCDIIVIGPGIGVSENSELLVKQVLLQKDKIVICDADALNILAAKNKLSHKCRLVITPHMGEMSRLCNCSISDIKGNQLDIARDYAKKNNCIVALKDARTVVSAPDKTAYVNTSGNSGMAKAGSGDVLTGVIAGMIAIIRANDKAFMLDKAVAIGVFVHGLAGDMCAKKYGKHSMVAGDMVKSLEKCIKKYFGGNNE